MSGVPKVCATFMNKNTQYFGTACGLHKIWGHQMLKKTTKPRWHMLSTNSRTHSLPWNISGNQKQTLPLNTVMAFTWKEMNSYWKVWASLWVDEGCLLWCSSVCFCTMPMVSVPLLNKLLGASLLGHRDSASNIYSMEKYNVTINWLVNTKDMPDLTKWLDWILNSLIQHLDSLSYPSNHQAEGEWLDWLDSLSFSFL